MELSGNDHLYQYKQVQEAKEQINGVIIREITGLEGKNLGQFIRSYDLNLSLWEIEEVEIFNRLVRNFPNYGPDLVGICFEDWLGEEMSDIFVEKDHMITARRIKPKIIQILIGPNDANWQGKLLGLGDNGVAYVFLSGEWVQYAPSITEE